MVSEGWDALRTELQRWREAGLTADFWWRDDDATHLSPAVERLLELSKLSDVPLALAVIPVHAEPGLFHALPERVDVLQHGFDHQNRAATGDKKTEYPSHEPVEAALARLKEGMDRLRTLAGARSLRVLAPPWNRIAPQLLPGLRSGGFLGLSGYGARLAGQSSLALTQINTHVDLIAWKADRGFIGADQALAQAVCHLAARREGRADPNEPTGWLTHHACHDEPCWEFLAMLFERLRSEPAVRWRSARELFSAAPAEAGRS